MKVPIVFCADGNYGRYLPVVVQSIIENSAPVHEYQIIIFDCGIRAEDLGVLERQIAKYGNFYLRIENITDWLDRHQHIAAKSSWNRAIYGRLLVPELCADYEKVIYADVDMIFNCDIAELMELDLGDNYIAAAIAITKEIHRAIGDKRTISFIRNILGMADNQPYINSGLLVYNINAWHKQDLVSKSMQFLEANKTRFPDQDAINAICKGKIHYLSQKWNFLMRIKHKWQDIANTHMKNHKIQELYEEWIQSYECNFKIIHFIALKPWISILMPKASIWWYYAAKTEIHEQLLVDALAFNNQANLVHQGEPLTYHLFGLPLFSVRELPGMKKYYIGKMRQRHLVDIRFDKRTGYMAFYLLEMKLFSRVAA